MKATFHRQTSSTGVHIKRKTRGGILVTSLVFSVVFTFVMTGIGTLAFSHYSRTSTDIAHAKALDLAEAGINYELYKLNLDATNASPATGATYPLGDGTFTVKVTNRDGTAWSGGTDIAIESVGEVAGLQRTVQVNAKKIEPLAVSPGLAAFSIEPGQICSPGVRVTGDIGTNTRWDIRDGATISGRIKYHGGTGVLQSPYNAQQDFLTIPAEYKLVNDIALEHFPNSGATIPGGIDYVSIRNDNATASPPIENRRIDVGGNETYTLGPGNYYLDVFSMSGNTKLILDNRTGPVYVWFNPCALVYLAGDSSIEVMDDSGTHPTVFYIVHVAYVGGNFRGEGTYYAHGSLFGILESYVLIDGNASIRGQVVSRNLYLRDSSSVEAVGSTTNSTGRPKFEFDNDWKEVNPVH